MFGWDKSDTLKTLFILKFYETAPTEEKKAANQPNTLLEEPTTGRALRSSALPPFRGSGNDRIPSRGPRRGCLTGELARPESLQCGETLGTACPESLQSLYLERTSLSRRPASSHRASSSLGLAALKRFRQGEISTTAWRAGPYRAAVAAP